MTVLEQRLRDALVGGAGAVHESPDLFARVRLSIDEDRRRRSQHRRAAALGACILGSIASLVVAVTDFRQGELRMDWWILELMTTGLLIAIALWLGPFIKRFGKSFAADVFRANPGTGKSFIVLTDFAYYLIFLAYILFTVSFEAGGDWESTVNASQLKDETARVAGIFLIIGLLHGVNLIALPVMGRLLTLNRRLDQDTPAIAPPPANEPRGDA
ncbi:MAG TPA: hypothetical protein VFZ83_10905 [Acidimicrobiia bacterium]|nr:hypothetical protein [Acidimicrobiia bacterium]